MKSRERILDEQLELHKQIIINRNRDLRLRDEKIATLEADLAQQKKWGLEAHERAGGVEERMRDAFTNIMEIENRRNPHLGRPRASGAEKDCIFCIAYFGMRQGLE